MPYLSRSEKNDFFKKLGRREKIRLPPTLIKANQPEFVQCSSALHILKLSTPKPKLFT